MYKISALLLAILFISLTGCEDKKPDESLILIRKTTEVISKPEKNTSAEEKSQVGTQSRSDEKTASISSAIITGSNTFMLRNTESESHKVTVSNGQVTSHQNNKAIVLINLFATWCSPCMSELTYMNTLHKKYHNDLFLIGVLMHDPINIPSLESFIAQHKIKYFISNSQDNNAFGEHLATTLKLPKNFSIPLTVMYVDGKYFTHYEGSVPVEMIEYDIQQAQEQLKHNKN